MRLFRYPLPTLYAETHAADSSELDTPYMVIEYINPSRGQMLSTTWNEGRDDPQLRSNLFRGLSKIMLTLMRIPLPRIGSFTLDDNGYLSLSNRPLNMDIQQLENEGISVNIPRDSTHLSVASYVYDIFAVHESRLRHQPNAVNDLEDGIYQTSALTMMRSVWSCFFSQDRHRGRFFLHLTDLSQSNVFVDKNWNINCIMDLEWAFSHPLEMIHPPHWLSNEAIDMITIDPFKVLYDEFMDTFAQVENQMDMPIGFHSTMKESLENGTFWCSLALSSPTALFAIFYDYIQPIFSRDHDGEAFWKITMYYWSFKAFKFLKQKVEDKQKYDISLREAFES